MSKGDETRQRVVGRAFERASALGLEGLSLGELATELDLSKSGLFAHFGSKQALQLEVIAHAAERFVERVVVPALNLRGRFGFDPAPYDARTRLIVVHRDSRHVGLVVDSAREFVRIPDDVVQPPGEGLTALSGRYLRGIATIGERMIFILDLNELLDTTTLSAGDGPAVPRSFQET